MLRIKKFTSQILGAQAKLYCAYYSTSKQPIKEERIKIAKWNINYIKVGQGPHNLLCLPGALGTIWTDFKPQIEGFDKEKFTVVVWDPPGYGKSRPPNKDFTTDFLEKDAECALEFMKALKIPKYSILGWSDGGITGLIHAAKYPEVMVKLVIFGSKSCILPEDIECNMYLKDVSTWSEKLTKPMTEVYGNFFPKYCRKYMVEGFEAIYNVKKGNICAHLLKDIQCPTFILHGKKDRLASPVHASDLLTKITNSKLHLYPDGKHNIHLRYADDFNKRVQEFLLES